MRVRRASTSCVTSLTILALVLDGSVWNHFARRTLPVGVSKQNSRAGQSS